MEEQWTPGVYPDGAGLSLVVTARGVKRWGCKFKRARGGGNRAIQAATSVASQSTRRGPSGRGFGNFPAPTYL